MSAQPAGASGAGTVFELPGAAAPATQGIGAGFVMSSPLTGTGAIQAPATTMRPGVDFEGRRIHPSAFTLCSL
jgi:hypothetical protein